MPQVVSELQCFKPDLSNHFVLSGPQQTRQSVIDNFSMKWIVNCGNTNEMKMWSSQMYCNLISCEVAQEKGFRCFSGIQTQGLCFRTAVLYQLSYEDPHIKSRSIYWVHQPLKGVKHRMKWILCPAEIQMKWRCDHLSCITN